MTPEPSRSELLVRIAELEARLAASETAKSDIAVTTTTTERKQAKPVSLESDRELVSIYSTVRDVIFQLAVEPGDQFRFVSVNSAFLKITGLSPESVIGRTVKEVIPEPSLAMVLERYRQAIAERAIVSWEETSDYPTGRLTGEVSIAPIFDGNGVCTHLVGSVHDITTQKHLAERLRDQTVQLLEAQRLARIGSWERHLDTGVSYWSDELRRILGAPNSAPAGMETFLNCLHPGDREKALDTVGRARLAREPVEALYRVVWPDGQERLIRSIVQSVRNDQEDTVRLIGATQDITEQIRAQERLRESEERLKNAERIAHLGHWQLDIAANRVSGSEEMYRIFGKPPDFVPSYDGFLGDLSPRDRERMAEAIKDSLERRVGHSLEYQFALPNGDQRTMSCTWEVSADDAGAPVRIFGTCQDITDSRRSQAEAFARQKLESIGVLASGIAHDFNNLLGAVLAQTELAMVELAAGFRPDEELKAVQEVAIRGAEIVRQLMIYGGKENESLELVDVSKVVEGMQSLLKIAVSRRTALVTDLGRNLPAVRARPAQLSQIVMNLVVNASDAIGDRDGVVRVATEHIPADAMEPIANELPAGDYVRLEISDTGCGMSPETQTQAFDPFFTTKVSGRGLGLSIVHGIVRNLSGNIQVASEPGKGATFQVLLPCAGAVPQPRAEQAIPVDDVMAPAHRATVLVVEDEDQLRLAVAKMLRKSGLETFEAANGSAAIDLLRARGGEIDLILLDLTIPGPSSAEVLAQAAIARPDDMKVILASAYSEEVAKPLVQAPIVRGFIRKPFELGELLQRVRTALSS
jgi:two-component system, cell cycle sensor histidine kinase and response regulator CckA